MSPPRGWVVHRVVESAAAFHARDPGFVEGRQVWVVDVDAPAIVLGSTQAGDVIDEGATRRAGLAVVRRRSGGGVVLVRHGEVLWVDVLVPREDPLWHEDVGRSFHWLGESWRRALSRIGVDASVHEGPLRRGRWGGLVCFASRGPGEVLQGEAKLVGLAQRRTRSGARLQCAAILRWEPERLVPLLALHDEQRAELARDLERLAAPVPAPAGALLDSFLAELPA